VAPTIHSMAFSRLQRLSWMPESMTSARRGNAGPGSSQPAQRVVLVHAHLVGQLLGVERPAFDEGVEADQRADLVDLVLAFGEVGALPGVTGIASCMVRLGQGVARPVPGIGQVHVVDRRPRPIERGEVHVAEARAGLDVRRHALDLHGRLQAQLRELGHVRPDRGDRAVQVGDQVRSAGVGVG
jgi:hypothetical protein